MDVCGPLPACQVRSQPFQVPLESRARKRVHAVIHPPKALPSPTPSQARCRPWGPRDHSSLGRGARGAPRARGTVFCWEPRTG